MDEHKETFNMAVATLMRLDAILKRMERYAEVYQGIQGQKIQIQLARHFVLNASPLISIVKHKQNTDQGQKAAQAYQKRIFSITIPSKLFKGKRREYYDEGVDQALFSVCMEIQILLKNFFMAPAKKKSMF